MNLKEREHDQFSFGECEDCRYVYLLTLVVPAREH